MARRTAVSTSSGSGHGRPVSLAISPPFLDTTTWSSTRMSNWPHRPFSSSTGAPSSSWIVAAKLAAFRAIVPQVSQ
jgi:hypothetical protein